MNDLGGLLDGLPTWVQAVALVVVTGIAVLVGKRRSASRRRRGDASAPGGVRSQRTPLGWAEHRESPGRLGPGATRDLAAADIRALKPSYSPRIDGDPDPGEVVWTWVPYVENDGRGKDRPVLIIARLEGGAFAACYLSTKQHRGFVSVGTGGWDSQGRESFLAPDRVLRVSEDGMRREGQVLDRDRFARAVEAVSRLHGIRP